MRAFALSLATTVTFLGAPIASSAPVPTVLLCQALLEAGKDKSSNNPLPSLRDVRFLLSQLPAGQNATPVSPYQPIDLKIDIDNPSAAKAKVQNAVSRLAQLENHVTQVNFDGTYVGFELRGEEQVRAAYARVSEEIRKNETQAHAELRRRYPALRAANLLNYGVSAALLSSMIGDPTSLGLEVPILAAAVAMKDLMLPVLKKLNFSHDFQNQLSTINDALSNPDRTAQLHILSADVEIRTELHKVFMETRDRALSDEELQLIVDAAENLYRRFGDDNWRSREISRLIAGLSLRQKYEVLMEYVMNETKYFPEGRTRQAYVDSIFYYDKETNEPVWLIFYRAFKSRPIPPKPPRKEEQRHERERFIPAQPALAPAYAR